MLSFHYKWWKMFQKKTSWNLTSENPIYSFKDHAATLIIQLKVLHFEMIALAVDGIWVTKYKNFFLQII